MLVNYLDLPYMYLFVVIFSLISLLQDQKIKTAISKHYTKTWKKFYSKIKKESKQKLKIEKKTGIDQPFFGEN